jgi:hypothetical protein
MFKAMVQFIVVADVDVPAGIRDRAITPRVPGGIDRLLDPTTGHVKTLLRMLQGLVCHVVVAGWGIPPESSQRRFNPTSPCESTIIFVQPFCDTAYFGFLLDAS